MKLDADLVRKLIANQFPSWANLPIRPVTNTGWDNRTFHLGDTMSVRLPSRADYAPQVQKEQTWLPKLSPHLPLSIPEPLAMGQPSTDYPWHWSVYQWLEGETASLERIDNLNLFAEQLGLFLRALQACDTCNAPAAGAQNFYRGSDLATYNEQTLHAIEQLNDHNQANRMRKIWQQALSSQWADNPVWLHGDVAIGNLLVNKGKLSAVIDFGQLAIGDPACDLAIYWTFLSETSCETFKNTVDLDEDTWLRARGWVLWKTLCAPIANTDTNKILLSL